MSGARKQAGKNCVKFRKRMLNCGQSWLSDCLASVISPFSHVPPTPLGTSAPNTPIRTLCEVLDPRRSIRYDDHNYYDLLVVI